MTYQDIQNLESLQIDPEIIHCIDQLFRLQGAKYYHKQLKRLVVSLSANMLNRESASNAIKALHSKIHGSNRLVLAIKWTASKLITTIAVILAIPVSIIYAPALAVVSFTEQLSLNLAQRKKADKHNKANLKGEKIKKRGIFQGLLMSIVSGIIASFVCLLVGATKITRLFKSKRYEMQQFLSSRLQFLSRKGRFKIAQSKVDGSVVDEYLSEFRTLSSQPQNLDLNQEYTAELILHTVHAGWVSLLRPLKGHLGNHGQSIIRVTQGGQHFYKYYNTAEEAKNLFETDYEQFVAKPAVLDFATPTALDANKLEAILSEIDQYKKSVEVPMGREDLRKILAQHKHYHKRYDLRYFPNLLYTSKAEYKAALEGEDSLRCYLTRKKVNKTSQQIKAMLAGHQYVSGQFFPGKGTFDCIYYLQLLSAPYLNTAKSEEFSAKIQRSEYGMKYGLPGLFWGPFFHGVSTTVEEANNSSVSDKFFQMLGR